MSIETATRKLEARLGDFMGFGYRVAFDLGEDGVIAVDGRANPPTVSQEAGEADCTIRLSADNLGKLIDGVSKAGSNKIDSLRFDTTDREEYKKKALELAVKDARSTAETVAQAAGVKIVNILSIRPGADIPMPVYNDYAVRGKMAMAEAAPTPIEPGELRVNATVTMVFEIQ